MTDPYREGPILVIPKIRRVLPTWFAVLSSLLWLGVGYGIGFSKTPRVVTVEPPGACLDAVKDDVLPNDNYHHEISYTCLHPMHTLKLEARHEGSVSIVRATCLCQRPAPAGSAPAAPSASAP
jgi:hypothetical protein